MQKVSVIVPVYNVEAYLPKCLDSLLHQTLKEIDIIVVNDGATDGSLAIAEEYHQKYENISVYTKENGGLASARNYGLKYASGEYIAFIDSDDWVSAEMLQTLYNTGIEENADIVVCDIEQVDEEGNGFVIPQLDESIGNIKKAHMIASPGFCNRIFKKAFLERVGFRFFEGIFFEDLAVHAPLVAQAEKISYVKQGFYKYYVRQGSITRQTQKNDKLLDAFKSIDYLYGGFEKLPNRHIFSEELEYIYIKEFLHAASYRLLPYRVYDEHIKRIAVVMSERFPKWRKNSYYKKYPWKMKVVCNLLYYKQPKLVRKLIGIRG